MKGVDWQGENIFNKVLKKLKLKYDELADKVLILDGFDEIDTKSDRKRILNKMYEELKFMNYLGKFSLIMTCRENYIDKLHDLGCDYIILQTWDEEQIKSFCDVYREKGGGSNIEVKKDNLLENKEIFGIPLILYMVLALDVSIEKVVLLWMCMIKFSH